MTSAVVSMPREILTASMHEITLDDVDPLIFMPKISSTFAANLRGLLIVDKAQPRHNIWRWHGCEPSSEHLALAAQISCSMQDLWQHVRHQRKFLGIYLSELLILH